MTKSSWIARGFIIVAAGEMTTDLRAIINAWMYAYLRGMVRKKYKIQH